MVLCGRLENSVPGAQWARSTLIVLGLRGCIVTVGPSMAEVHCAKGVRDPRIAPPLCRGENAAGLVLPVPAGWTRWPRAEASLRSRPLQARACRARGAARRQTREPAPLVADLAAVARALRPGCPRFDLPISDSSASA